jgi:hypothetical protein
MLATTETTADAKRMSVATLGRWPRLRRRGPHWYAEPGG